MKCNVEVNNCDDSERDFIKRYFYANHSANDDVNLDNNCKLTIKGRQRSVSDIRIQYKNSMFLKRRAKSSTDRLLERLSKVLK